MRSHAPGAPLRSVTAQFHRPIRHAVVVEATTVHAGATATTTAARATSAKGVHVTASAVFGSAPRSPGPVTAATAPAPAAAPPAPPPQDCPVFAVPRELVPIADRVEIRPVGSARPYAGGVEPALTAWVRLVEDDDAPDALRLVFLMDALAPSYAAVLRPRS